MFKQFMMGVLTLSLLSCSSDSTVTYFQLNGVDYLVVGADSLTKTDSSITGTGKIAFREALAREGNKYVVTFTLEDGGSVNLVAHSNSALANGISVKVTRVGLLFEGKMIHSSGEVAMSGVTGDATGQITLKIDVHNDETPAHILVATGADADLYDSEAAVASPGNGDGTVWGVELASASLLAATVGEPSED